MKDTDLAHIIEELGRNIDRYDRKSVEAYHVKDFQASHRYHEKAMAMEKRVEKYLQSVGLTGSKPLVGSRCSLPQCLCS